MRTKTVIISAVAGLIACVSAMADTNVYSLNAVGYINVTCAPGFTMFANQLNNVVNGSVDNSLNALIANPDSGDGIHGTMDGFQVYKYNGSTYASEAGDFSNGGWSNGGLLVFNPGEAGWIRNNRATNVVITFFGEVLQGTQVNTIPGGPGNTSLFSMRSSIVPQAGGLDSVLGLSNVDSGDGIHGTLDGDQVSVWNGASYVGSTADFSNGGWNPSEPVLNVGQGFFYRTRTTRTWTRTFSANN